MEEKSKLFALLQRPQSGESGESYTAAEHGLRAAHRLRMMIATGIVIVQAATEAPVTVPDYRWIAVVCSSVVGKVCIVRCR
ncbi:MAG: hypothetical protein Q4F21_09430 [Lachnospiraceae bacterium]|nr:hypothetical protein [Lachnospiraceae bacterium]